jgi:hypothetical protein
MKSVRSLVFLCLIALFLVALPAFAQDNPFGLSEADWELFQTGSGNLADNSAYSMTLEVSLDTSGQIVAVNLEGVGQAGSNGFSSAVSGSIAADGQETPVVFQVLVVDDMIYLSLDGESWYSTTGDELLEMVSQFATMGMGMSGMGSAMPVDPEALAGGDMSSVMMMPGMMEAMTALNDIDPSSFITITREDDMDGAAHFQTVLSFANLMNDPAIMGMMMTYMSSMSGMSGMDASQMTPEMLEQMGPMMAQMFGESGVTVDHYINAETGELVGATFTLDLTTAMGAQSVAANIVFDVEFSDAGDAVVEAPANAQPLSEMMGAMMGMGMGS